MPITAIDKKIMLAQYRKPSITGYNRLEAVPRSADFSRSLAAEIRDPLWMLARQWQFGEFKGEDAASPVSAMILGEHTPIDRMSPGVPGDPPGAGSSPASPASTVYPYDGSMPLETMVEAGIIKDNLFLAAQIARYFVRLMRAKSLPDAYVTLLNTDFQPAYLIDPNDKDGLQLSQALGGEFFDGCAVLHMIRTPSGTGNAFTDWLQAQDIHATDRVTLSTLAGTLSDWHSRNYTQPAGNGPNKAWSSSTLDYGFQLASPVYGLRTPAMPGADPAAAANTEPQQTLSALHFPGGHLDWYSFDLDTTTQLALKPEPQNPPALQENLVSFIPAPVSFKGMPNPRFWMLEDSQTDLGSIDTTPTGLLHLSLAEFGLIYGNDWFMLPYPLSVNNLCAIRGLVILDVFGENTWIEPAGAGTGNEWQNWAMFRQTDLQAANGANHLFYLAPAIYQSLDDQPLEEVNFLRDEMAEMVWAVESTVPSQSGKGANGNQMALKSKAPAPFVPAGGAAIQYILGTTVPDNWIPFIPVHMEGSDTEIRFQRAGMPGAKGALGEILNETPAPYYILEEIVPRAGTVVQRAFKRTRWLNGKTFLWIGRTKETGKGEGWSNLKFDQIVPISQADHTSG